MRIISHKQLLNVTQNLLTCHHLCTGYLILIEILIKYQFSNRLNILYIVHQTSRSYLNFDDLPYKWKWYRSYLLASDKKTVAPLTNYSRMCQFHAFCMKNRVETVKTNKGRGCVIWYLTLSHCMLDNTNHVYYLPCIITFHLVQEIYLFFT